MTRNLAVFFGSLFLVIGFFGYAATSPQSQSILKVNQSTESQYGPGNVTAAVAPTLKREPKLAEARQGFVTKIAVLAKADAKLPAPPANIFVASYYTAANGQMLPTYVTPNPHDGLKHPAIIWLSGGDTNSLEDFWTPGSKFSQSVEAFRAAGIVVMLPVLRGANSEGAKEYFLGEVDDVLAAADHLSQLGYVDADHIFLGGHGTGGTLALLTAETSSKFSSVFAFGPVAEVNRYSASVVPVNFREQDAQERKLRSPIHWLHGIASSTYVIEGRNAESIYDAEALCAKTNNPHLHCILVDGEDHANTLAKISTVIAARMAISKDRAVSLHPGEFNRQMLSENLLK